jgi:DNA mismatch repair protein MutL
MPKVSVNPDYNPFRGASSGSRPFTPPAMGWEQLYKGFESEKMESVTAPDTEGAPSIFRKEETGQNRPETELFPEHYQFKQKYILTSVKSGLMIIDQHKAHVRILFDKYLEQIRNRKGVSQRVLFPEVLELSASEAATLPSVYDDMEALGFELSELGDRSFAIQGVPSEIENSNPSELIRGMIHRSMETGSDAKTEIQESIALSLAAMTAIPHGKVLTSEEMLLVVSELFASKTPTYTPDGQVIVSVITDKEIEKKMN